MGGMVVDFIFLFSCKRSDERRWASRRVAMGLERSGAGYCCVAPPVPDQQPRPARQVPESAFLVAKARLSGRRLDPRRRHQLGAVQGLEFNVGSGGSGSGPGVLDMRWSRDSRRAGDGRLAAALRSTALGPRAPDGPGLDHTQCASSCGTGARRPHASGVSKAFTVVFICPSHLVVRVARPGPGLQVTGRAAGHSGHRPGSCSLAMLSAPPVTPLTRAVSTAAVQSGSWHTAEWSPGQPPGPGQRRPGGQWDVSARQACDSRLSLP